MVHLTRQKLGEDVAVYNSIDAANADKEGRAATETFHFLRQQRKMAGGLPNYSLVDFIADDKIDYLGGFAVTTGLGLEPIVAAYEAQHDDYQSIMAKALADRLAESFAEKLHQQIRTQFWGYADETMLSNEDLIREKYQGIRPAPGYPACPDHTENPHSSTCSKHLNPPTLHSLNPWPCCPLPPSAAGTSPTPKQILWIGKNQQRPSDSVRRKKRYGFGNRRTMVESRFGLLTLITPKTLLLEWISVGGICQKGVIRHCQQKRFQIGLLLRS